MRRLVSILTAVFLLGVSLSASAKMPPFEMEVETRGDAVYVTVTIAADDPLPHGFDPPDLNWLLAVLPAGRVDEEGRPQLVRGVDREHVPLSRIESGTYQGSVTVGPGRWAVVPFPDTSGALKVPEAYPDPVIVEIEDRTIWPWTLAALLVAVIVRRRRKHTAEKA